MRMCDELEKRRDTERDDVRNEFGACGGLCFLVWTLLLEKTAPAAGCFFLFGHRC